MRKLRVVALMHEDFVPPDCLDGLSEKQVLRIRTEYDVVTALEELEHDTRVLGVTDDIAPIRRALLDFKPQIVFNLLEEFRGQGVFVPFVLGYLQLMHQAFTGCNPTGLMLADNKPMMKKILRYHRIPIPDFAVFRRGRAPKRPARLVFPLIVKSASEHGSVGIAQASVVTSEEKFRERVAYVHDDLGTDAIAEEYIDGREVYVAVMGNDRLDVFPPRELLFENLADGAFRIATHKVKWDPNYQEQRGIKAELARDLPNGVGDRLRKLSKRVYRILGLGGYARLDFRIRGDRAYLLEANPNPDLARDEDFAEAARAAGTDYERLIQRIVSLGCRLHRD